MKVIISKFKLPLFSLILGSLLAYFIFLSPKGKLVGMIINTKPTPIPTKFVSEVELKKQALAEFYNEIIDAEDRQDWIALYKLVPQSIRDNITEAQFNKYYSDLKENDTIVSRKTMINSIVVTGDKGVVDRTFVSCLSKDCTGDNRKEDHAKREYEYIDGKWQILDPQPSDRALKVANDAYEYSDESNQEEMIERFGNGSTIYTYAIHNFALYLDSNKELLIANESKLEKYKADLNRPVINYEPPDINVQQQAPIQQNYPQYCTSHTIGSSTYTNCY